MNRIIAYTRNNKPHVFRQFISEKKPYSIDLSKLESEVNDSFSTVTWIVDSGSATITNEALASSEATANIEATQEGRQLIKAVCEGATTTHTVYISLKVNDPKCTAKDY